MTVNDQDPYSVEAMDSDPEETSEWAESLDALVAEKGHQRAREIMLSLLKRSKELHLGVPMVPTTDYLNTIAPENEPEFPGDEEIERRYRAWIRWNAAMLVHRAQRPGIAVGGHISTYASSAALYEVGFNHFFRGQDHPGGGDQIFIQGHASPGTYARAFLEGRLERRPARRLPPGEVARPQRPVVVPAPAAHARVLAVPDGLDGPRPDQRDLPGAGQPVPHQPRHQGRVRPARVGVPRRRRDGRGREPRPAAGGRERGPRQPHVRHQLQPPAPRRPGARQRQDHPGARELLPRRRLERHQGRLGPRVGRPARARPRRRAAQPHERHARRRLPDLQGRVGRLRARELLRPRPARARAREGPLRRADLEPEARRPRLPQGVRGVQGGHRAQGPAHRHPGEDDQGLRPRSELRGPQRDPPDEEDDARQPQDVPRRDAHPDHRRAARGEPVPARRTTTRASRTRRSSTCTSVAASSAATCPSAARTTPRSRCPTTRPTRSRRRAPARRRSPRPWRSCDS